jgi:hypothetical protein
MEMRQTLFIGLTAILPIFFQSCSNKKATTVDVIGTWANADGATLELHKDGTFAGKSLPAVYFTFFTSKKDVEGKKVNGSGNWRIEGGQGFDEVKLDFKKMNGTAVNGFYSVMISGTGGPLENKPPWSLFAWKEEEGGQRYTFEKK